MITEVLAALPVGALITAPVAAIDINIDPHLIDGGITLTWHGFFTAVGIALGVWLSLRLARRIGIPDDDGLSIAIYAVFAGVIGARLLWVFEHTDQIDSLGDVFAITDGGISVYGALIGGVIGGFGYVVLFKREFPRWKVLDVAAPGMILGQAVGRVGDFINGEHFASATDLGWAFRYVHPKTDGPWAVMVDGEIPSVDVWSPGQRSTDELPVPVHPVAGGYEPVLDLLLLGALLWMFYRTPVRHGWIFVTYVVGYALIRGLLAVLRADEQTVVGDLSVPQLIAVLTAAGAGVMAYYLWRHPQTQVAESIANPTLERDQRREDARQRRTEHGEMHVRKRGDRYRR